MRLRAPSLVGSLAIAAIVAACSAAPSDDGLQPGGSASSEVATAAGIPRATPGDVRAISTPSEASTPAFVITPVGRVDLKLSLVRGATLDSDGRREPPAGGAFVVIEATGLPESMASTPLLVSTVGKEYPVSVSAPRMAVAVPTDGRDARVGVGYDGLVQWIDVASGKRVGHIPRGYYDTIADAVDTVCPDLAPATMSVGFRRIFGCTVQVKRSPYLAPTTGGAGSERRTVGWNTEDNVYVSVRFAPRYAAYWRPKGTSNSASYTSSTSLNQLSLLVSGTSYGPLEIYRESSTGPNGSDWHIAVFDVPAGQATMSFTGEVVARDVLADGAGLDAPARGRATVPVALTFTFPPVA